MSWRKKERGTRDIYLTDSPSGLVWFFDFHTGSIKGRYQIDSRWLHDVEQISGSIFAAGLGDINEIQIFDKESGEILNRFDASRFGQSVMFLNACEVEQSWSEVLQPESNSQQLTQKTLDIHLGDEQVLPIIDFNLWHPVSDCGVEIYTNLHSNQKLQYEYLLIWLRFFCLSW